MFTRDDAKWLSSSIHRLYAAGTTAELSQSAITSLQERFTMPVCSCEELNHSASAYILHGAALAVPAPDGYAAHIHDHPFAPLLSTLPPTLHLRSRVPLSVWSKTDHFNGIARPMGYRDQFIIRAQSLPSTVIVSVFRDTLFVSRERDLLQLLQPHFTRAWARVRGVQTSFDDPGEMRILLSESLRPIGLSAGHAATLRIYFPGWLSSARLPDALLAWVMDCRARLHGGTGALVLQSFAVESARGQLLMRYFPLLNGSGAELRAIERPSPSSYFRLRAAGFTSRECEILHWAAQGKRDAEIAVILGITSKTVGKHIEHIFAKLHVESRAAAVASARDRLGSL